MTFPVQPGTVKVPGAKIYFEQRGSGPVLLMIPGGPADAGVFAALADALASRYTRVAYDPRGNSRSTLDGEPVDQDLDIHGDDAAALIDAIGSGPAYDFGNSGGAQIGLNLAPRHPGRVRVLVAHEPPCVRLLPDGSQHIANNEIVSETYRREGVGPAMQKFMAFAGLVGGPRNTPQPHPATDPQAQQSSARIGGNMAYFIGHGIKPISSYLPDVAALRGGPVQVLVGVGEASAGQIANRCGVALAEQFGTAPATFPGDHGGFGTHPAEFAAVLMRLLS